MRRCSSKLPLPWMSNLISWKPVAAMERCADKLRPPDRELIGLRYLPGATVKRIAEQLGRPANSVCKSLARIRQTLWDCINDELAMKAETARHGTLKEDER